ncbi:MAG: peroxidase family protein, partial [Alphaproteobacteria bacterium]|nr:peroxidase family protein [Alphaproteobacteria bacterium]
MIVVGLLGLGSTAIAAPMAPPTIPVINLDDPDSFRTFDGTGNNLLQPELGAAGESLIRFFPADYDDGSSMSGGDRPNPREISNAIGDQTMDMPSTRGLSAAFWSFGQLLAHDITLVPQSTDPDELANILVAGDDFDGLIDAIPFRRSIFDPATGTDAGNPRQQVNEITAFIDASFVYGSDDELAGLLRANDGSGRLITGPGNMLPTNGQLDIDDDPANDILFVAGDPRANEQLALAAMHTIFLREHNRLADYIRQTQPGLSDDEIFQSARTILAAEMQA